MAVTFLGCSMMTSSYETMHLFHISSFTFILWFRSLASEEWKGSRDAFRRVVTCRSIVGPARDTVMENGIKQTERGGSRDEFRCSFLDVVLMGRK